MIGFRETSLDQLAVDHRIEVNTLTGTARLSVPIRTSPGRDSFGPSLALGYSSGQGKSTFGVGWFLSGIPSIGLDTTRALPTYREGRDEYVYAGGQPLVATLREEGGGWVPVVDDVGAYQVKRFRSKTERSFERFERWMHRTTGRVHWIVYARNGVVSVFGLATDGSTRIADPTSPDQRTFQWLLEAQYDPKGNAIVYQYKPEDGAGVDATLSFESRRARGGAGFAQRYLKRIFYGNSRPLSLALPSDAANEWRFEVVFDYGEHGAGPLAAHSDAPPSSAWTVRSDAFSTHRPGFELRSYRLCRRVLMFHRFPELDGGTPCLVGATELSHNDEPAGTVLEAITYRGYRKNTDGSTSHRAVPGLGLTYSGVTAGHAFEAAQAADNIPSGLDGAVYQWIDLQNEGLPGVLCRHSGSWYFKENLGDGRFGPMHAVDQVPTAVSAAFQLQDFDGDGNLNLVGFEGREAGYYQHNRDQRRWEGFRPLQSLPRVDFANARVQWVDLNGDGHADLIVERGDRLVWYASEGADGFSAAVEISKPDVRAGGAPTLTQSAGLHTFFADMTGDGLLDMVRVDSGRVEYWPNLGRGEFGPGVVMEDAPTIDDFGEVDTRRIRLVDLDGSGTADLLYLGRGEIRVWSNQSGNRFAAAQRLVNLPYIDQLSSAQVFDFLGDGTRCLVWSTPLPGHEGQAVQYLTLTATLPPRLLVSVANGIGRETKISYHSSAREYLRDKSGERPWTTLLPRHSMVVNLLEGIDHVGGGRMVTRYEYRDGYFDDDERRFVGFGLVDAFDSDQLVAGDAPPEQVTLPSVVRSWYHTGAGGGFSQRSQDFYARDPLAARPPLPEIEDVAGLTTEEQLDAYRAMAGVQWRQEFYALRRDGARQLHPYRTTEFAYRIRRLQPAMEEREAAYSFVQSESLSHEYEQDPSDPRVAHHLMLESDGVGNVTARAAVAYPRRSVGSEVRAEQQVLHCELAQSLHRNIDTDERFELGIETEERRYSLTGLALAPRQVFSYAGLHAQIQAALANPQAFHDPAASGAPTARLIGRRRNRFWDDARAAVADVGDVGPVTLLHHVERTVFPEAAVDPLYEGRVDGAMLSADGHYRRDAGFWWADDTTYHYRDPSAFFRLREETSPAGGSKTHSFDPHFLLVTAVEDLFGNRVESTPDYQVLASSQVKDANANVSEVLYDPLGVAFVTSLRGRQIGGDGNPHAVGDDDVATYAPVVGATAADVLTNPGSVLQGVTRFFFYDLEAFGRGEGPPRSIHLEREQHRHDGEGTPPGQSRIRTTLRYIDGFGRAMQTKVRADEGPAIQRSSGAVVIDGDGRPILAHSAERWLTSGHDVYNNKGWLARKYEPVFSTSPDFESDRALRDYGVAARTHYDPVGRIVREDLPNGTFTTSEYTAWVARHADANDNVAGSEYETARQALPTTDVRRRALDKARAHANTPTIVENDSLGRPIRLRETGAGGTERVNTTTYGVLGLPERITDARGLTAFTYTYDMLGHNVAEQSVDAGPRWTLLDAERNPVHQWDGRDVHSQYRYDRNGRHTETRVDGAVDFDGTVVDNIVERVTYGDDPAIPQATLRNARGRAVRRLDDAGVLLIERYHMDGQAIDVRRSLRSGYKDTVDWRDPTTVPVAGAEHRSQTRVDALGRVASQLLADGTTRAYDYARLGHVSEVRLSTADGVLERQVIASEIQTNARGQRTQLVCGNGVETSYEYDATTFRLERLYTRRTRGPARDYLDVEYAYDPVGNITHWIDRVQDPGAPAQLLQGLTVSSACEFTYDPHYQLEEATGRVHQALLQHDYRFGGEGTNPIKSTRHLTLDNGAAVERYKRTYAYDLAGNVQRTRHQGASQNWTTEMWTSNTSNRSLPKRDLNGVDVASPETRFDANGNTLALPHLRAMDWNYANRLARAVIIDRSGSGQPDDAEYYVYGADGLRRRRVTEKLVAGQLEVAETTYFEGCEIRRVMRGGNTRLLRHTSHITDGSGRLATLHQWSIDQAALETDDISKKKLHYLVGNHLGSVALELDEAGDVISYEEYFPFGGTSFLAGASARDVKLKEYRYSGKCRDDATGFYCYEYRYYAPFIGNWLSPDPLGPVDGLNLYRFVHNNPVRFVDLDGLETFRFHVDEKYQHLLTKNTEAARSELLERGVAPSTIQGEVGLQQFTGVWKWDSKEGENVAQYRDFWATRGHDRSAPEIIPSPEMDVGEIRDPVSPELKEVDVATLIEESSADGTSVGDEAGGGDSAGAGGNGDGTGAGDGAKGGDGAKSGDGANGGAEPKSTGAKDKAQKAASSKTTGNGAQPAGVEGGKGSAPKRDGAQVGGVAGGTGTSNLTGGSADAPQVPPGLPTGPTGVPYAPDLTVPEAGTPVTDPSRISTGTASGDARGEPGTDNGSSVRPGGTSAGSGTAAAAGGVIGGEGSSAGGESGGISGGSGWLTLPSWLSEPINAVADVIGGALDVLQFGLDIIGLIPGLGEIADGLNGLISLARGDYAGAALSFAAMIPFAGWLATGGKFGRRAADAADAVSDVAGAVTRHGDEAASAVSTVAKSADEAAEATVKNADELGSAAKPGGTATVHYRPNPDGTPHWTVETKVPGQGSLETHQVWTSRKGRSTEVFEVDPTDFKAPPKASVSVDLPDAGAARKMQQEQLGRGDTGPWVQQGPRANSCATAVCEVVSAGGGPFPSAPAQAPNFLRNLFKLPRI